MRKSGDMPRLANAPMSVGGQYYGSLCGACKARKCRYYLEWIDACNYMGMTGHARQKLCPAGEGCTVWEKEKGGAGHENSGGL